MPGRDSKRWPWANILLLPALGACARASWQWPLAQLALNNTLVEPGAHLPVWLLLALLLLPGLLTEILGERHGGRYAVTIGGAAVVVVATLLVTKTDLAGLWEQFGALSQGLDALSRLPAVVPALLLVFVFWIEGSLANWSRYAAAWRNVIIGATALVLLTALYAAWGRAAEAHLAVAMVVFLISNLLALALLAVRGTLALEQLRHSRELSVSRYWLSAMVVLILLLLLIGWAIASASAPEMVRAVLNALQAAASWLGRMVSAALVWLVVGIFRLLEPIIAWLQGLSATDPQLGGAEALGEQVRQLAEQSSDPATAPDWWRRLTTALGYVALAGIALWLLLRAVRRPRLAPPGGDEERESIYSAALLGAQLRALFNRRRDRGDAALYTTIKGADDPAEVRRAYQAVLQALQQRAWAREPGQTPHALASEIAAKLPAAAPALAQLTDAYTAARYGGETDAAQVRLAREASATVLALLATRG